MDKGITPLLNQYNQIKKNYPDQIVFFRMGDFYEMFGEDARIASEILGIALTSRAHGSAAGKIPLAGVPYHAADRYLAKLLQAGKKVVICEQTEEASPEKKLVKREVVEIITPGTVTIEEVLERRQNNYLASVYGNGDKLGLAYAELSTGEFKLAQGTKDRILERLKVLYPAEVLLPEGWKETSWGKELNQLSDSALTELEAWKFGYPEGEKALKEQLGVQSLEGFGCRSQELAVSAAGVILDYLKLTKKRSLPHIKNISSELDGDAMFLDRSTIDNLELFSTESRPHSLFSVLNQTKTAMGARLLKGWITRPLLKAEEINRRLEAVEELVGNEPLRGALRKSLARISDLERLAGKIGYGKAGPKDLVNLKNSLEVLPEVSQTLQIAKAELLRGARKNLPDCSGIVRFLASALVDDPPLTANQGSVIRAGYNAELDTLKAAVAENKSWIASLQTKERERTQIGSLKVGYNEVFGYYIEVTSPNLSKVPPDYIRKQTLANAERYITPELKENEELILNAEEKINRWEEELFLEIRSKAALETEAIQEAATLLAQIDVLSSFAETAMQNNYTKPDVNSGDQITIIQGRHPVLEKVLPSRSFIPNDCTLDNSSEQIHILTGPNMAGKSTYLRQVGLVVLMAQIGSFVPAQSAQIGVVDRIFTRVGAMDNISLGQSTFLVEMLETANILNNATSRSLILLDEVGRGTSTFDGLSLAWSVTEYLHNNPSLSAKTIFATHYHELTELAGYLPRVKNYQVAVKEEKGEIIFLRKIVPGGCDDSYGIEVAKLAGVPKEVLARAAQILAQLEAGEVTVRAISEKGREQSGLNQLGLFVPPSPVEKELENLELDKLTPLEALNKLAEIKQKLAR